MTAQFAVLAYFLYIKARLLIVISGLAPAAAHRHDFPGTEAELRLEGLAAVGTLALLRSSMDPVMMGCRLLAVLTYTYIAKARLASEL